MHDEYLKDFAARTGMPRRTERSGDEPQESTLPDLGDGYQAYARASAGPVYSLHCLLGAAGCRSFQYVHLDSDSSFTVERRGQVIALRFCGLKTVSVTIRGRNLRTLYDYIHQHRMPWVMQLEAERDFGENDDPVVTSIEIAELNENENQWNEAKPGKVLEMG